MTTALAILIIACVGIGGFVTGMLYERGKIE